MTKAGCTAATKSIVGNTILPGADNVTTPANPYGISYTCEAPAAVSEYACALLPRTQQASPSHCLPLVSTTPLALTLTYFCPWTMTPWFRMDCPSGPAHLSSKRS